MFTYRDKTLKAGNSGFTNSVPNKKYTEQNFSCLNKTHTVFPFIFFFIWFEKFEFLVASKQD